MLAFSNFGVSVFLWFYFPYNIRIYTYTHVYTTIILFMNISSRYIMLISFDYCYVGQKKKFFFLLIIVYSASSFFFVYLAFLVYLWKKFAYVVNTHTHTQTDTFIFDCKRRYLFFLCHDDDDDDVPIVSFTHYLLLWFTILKVELWPCWWIHFICLDISHSSLSFVE